MEHTHDIVRCISTCGAKATSITFNCAITTVNKEKSKGTMREAFPSLPFGSPTVDKDCRDKEHTHPNIVLSKDVIKGDSLGNIDREGQASSKIEGNLFYFLNCS